MKFTTQEVINMGAAMYDSREYTRADIKKWLTMLLDNHYAEFDIERMFDLIVG